jgi:hypothetical protein
MPYDLTKLRAAIAMSVCPREGYEAFVLGNVIAEATKLWSQDDERCRAFISGASLAGKMYRDQFTLADVLRAIDVVQKKDIPEWFEMTGDGKMYWMKGIQFRDQVKDSCWWLLDKDLDGQSDECKRFLEEIICK